MSRSSTIELISPNLGSLIHSLREEDNEEANKHQKQSKMLGAREPQDGNLLTSARRADNQKGNCTRPILGVILLFLLTGWPSLAKKASFSISNNIQEQY